MDYDVIIIGAGASGLTAAIAAARQGSSVLVIEQKEKAGKKILATGNGKCNFTNLYQGSECYRSDDSALIDQVLSCFDVSKTLQFFKELGIYPKEREGYLYPNSEQAASVLSVLLMECERLKVQFHYQEKVREIKKPFYTIITELSSLEEAPKGTGAGQPASKAKAEKKNKNNPNSKITLTINKATATNTNIPNSGFTKTYYTKKVILSTGGCASPKLGSDGSGYQLAQNLGHTLIKPLPALVQLKSPDKYCKTISGVRTHAEVKAYAEGRQIAEEKGEILFTDYGISGIPILQLSRFVAKALDQGKKVQLKLDFLPEVLGDELKAILKQRIEQNPRKNLEEMLVGLFNHKLSYVLILESGLDPYKIAKQLNAQEIERLASNMKELIIRINDTNSFDQAQVCSGGISTKEVNELTMESKRSKGLYLAGEILDVDGTCGGYNLQWAWSSGYLAGTAAGQK